MSNAPFNPFEHHHHHHHDDDDQVQLDLLDPAQQSLNDALRVSFALLKIAMLVVVVFYLFSNVFTIGDNERAVRLRFGRIVNQDQENMIIETSGRLHFGWPMPFEEVVKVDVSERTVRLNTAFMYKLDERDIDKTIDELAQQRSMQPLNPAEDGSLITGDANIVHGRWEVIYQIGDGLRTANYISNVGNERLAADLVERATRQAIIRAVAMTRADPLLSNPAQIESRVQAAAQEALDEMESGLVIVRATGRMVVPLPVHEARTKVDTARTEGDQQIQGAFREASEILGSTAGGASASLWNIIEMYEEARVLGDGERQREAEAALEHAFTTLRTGEAFGDREIGGEVSRVINDARTYRSAIAQRTLAEANHFNTMIERYNENPEVFVQLEWARMLQELLDPEKEIEVYFVKKGGSEYRVQIYRDPEIQQRREERRNVEAEERRRREAERLRGER